MCIHVREVTFAFKSSIFSRGQAWENPAGKIEENIRKEHSTKKNIRRKKHSTKKPKQNKNKSSSFAACNMSKKSQKTLFEAFNLNKSSSHEAPENAPPVPSRSPIESEEKNLSPQQQTDIVSPPPAPSSKMPQPATLKKWKETYAWLVITERNVMICKICSAQREKILLKNPSSPMSFITGTTNYKASTLKDHALSKCHATGVAETDHATAIAAGQSLPRKQVVQVIPDQSAIASGMRKMGEIERKGVKKLMDIAFFIAVKGRPFTDFKDHIELEKLHGVKFETSAYENETACREFISSIACYLFDVDIREKICRLNFIAILIDGTTDRAIKEQEVLYTMFVDPDSHKPTLAYFDCLEIHDLDQTADGMLEAIRRSFTQNNLIELWKKIIYLSADGASVNSGKDSGLIAKLQEENEWILFVWCFSHRLELALKDALADFTNPVDESLMNMYYLYQKSSKKLRELKLLFKEIDFEMYGDGVKPVKATGTRWIDHRIRAMTRLIDKFGLYSRHLHDFISREKNSKNKATVQGKLNKLLDAQVILRSCLLKDLLAPAKIFSLITQKEHPNIMETVEAVDKTKNDYKKLLTKFEKNQDSVFELPALKSVINEIEESVDSDDNYFYHGQKLKYYTRAKRYIADHCVFLVKSIIQCYDNRYWFDSVNESSDGTTNDHLIFHICKILNSTVWPHLPHAGSELEDENILKVQVKSISQVFDQFSSMDVFKNVKKEDVTAEFVSVVRYCQRYFDYENVEPLELWHKIMLLCRQKPEWSSIALIIEICLCTPCSNATLERFFSQLKIVKTDLRTSLSSSSLNSVLRIKLRGTSITEFNEKYSDTVVDYWYNQKERRVHQRKRKQYKKRKSSKKARETFDLEEFCFASDSDSDENIASESDED